MKRTSDITAENDEMRSEYHFDYSEARPNRFAEKMAEKSLTTQEKERIKRKNEAEQNIVRLLTRDEVFDADKGDDTEYDIHSNHS